MVDLIPHRCKAMTAGLAAAAANTAEGGCATCRQLFYVEFV